MASTSAEATVKRQAAEIEDLKKELALLLDYKEKTQESSRLLSYQAISSQQKCASAEAKVIELEKDLKKSDKQVEAHSKKIKGNLLLLLSSLSRFFQESDFFFLPFFLFLRNSNFELCLNQFFLQLSCKP